MTLSDVAARMRQTEDWLRRALPRLCRRHGFPRHVAGFRGVWDPAAIEGWLERQRPTAATNRAASAVPEADWADILDQRALDLTDTRH